MSDGRAARGPGPGQPVTRYGRARPRRVAPPEAVRRRGWPPEWAEQVAGFALSLVVGGLGVLAAMAWRGALFAWLARLAVYPFAVPVIDKVFMVSGGLAVLLAMLASHHWFAAGIAERRLGRRVLRAAGVTALAFAGGHLAFAAALGAAAWSTPRLALAVGELTVGVLLLVLARRARKDGGRGGARRGSPADC